MIVRHIDEIIGSDREVHDPDGHWISRRILLKRDGMGFSLHETIVRAGTRTRMHYRNHLEAVYCISGNGAIEDCATGERHELREGSMYALDQHDEHVVHGGTEDMRVVCVFNPPVSGSEVHDADGAYPVDAG